MIRPSAMDQRAGDAGDTERASGGARHHPFLAALGVLVAVDVAALLADAGGASGATVLARLFLPVVAGVLLVALGLTRSPARFGRVAAPVVAGAALARLIGLVVAVGADDVVRGPGPAADATLVVVYLLFFLSFDRPRAGMASGATAAMAFAVVAADAAIASDAALADDLVGPLQVLVLHAVVIGLLLVRPAPPVDDEATRREPGSAGARIVPPADGLTGPTSDAQLTSVVERELARSERHLLPLSVILIGLDDLRAITAEHGERMGDRVLREVSSVLAGVLRSVDTVGRWGDDGFLVIAPTTGPDDARALAMRCRYKLRHHPIPEIGPATASFGVSTFEIGDDVTSLVERATAALTDARTAGRDRVEVVSLEHRIAGESRRRSDSPGS